MYQRTSVGLDVHALSVVACAIDGQTVPAEQSSCGNQPAYISLTTSREYRHVTRRSSCPSTETETASGTAVPEAVSTCPLTNFSTYQLFKTLGLLSIGRRSSSVCEVELSESRARKSSDAHPLRRTRAAKTIPLGVFWA
ncbi:hypothetical protein DVG80_28125 [Rhodococcus erythropolis]|nr:hypothetical protein DVG80_28125 [Rhodococcus erythropolis]